MCRLWLFLLQFIAAKTAHPPGKPWPEKASGEESAEELVLLVEEMFARGINVHFDVLAALAAPTRLPSESRPSPEAKAEATEKTKTSQKNEAQPLGV